MKHIMTIMLILTISMVTASIQKSGFLGDNDWHLSYPEQYISA